MNTASGKTAISQRRWTVEGRGKTLFSQRSDFANALQAEGTSSRLDNDGLSTVYAYLRDKDSARGKAGSPYYIGVAGSVRRPYEKNNHFVPVPKDHRRIRLLRSGLTHEQARQWERFFIEKYGRMDASTGRRLVHNRTDGGEGVVNLSNEAKSRIAAVSRQRTTSDETRQKMRKNNLGKIRSSEHKARISASLKKMPEEAKARLRVLNLGRRHSAEAKTKMSEAALKRSEEEKAKCGLARMRNNAARLGVDPDIWISLSKSQRGNAPQRAKEQGVTLSQYIEKMRQKWCV
jgi:hypothetical protein